jgi:CheY-like chemotaxis protein
MSTTTILVADENDATRAFLADNLSADGYRVLCAGDRSRALALAYSDLDQWVAGAASGSDLRG